MHRLIDSLFLREFGGKTLRRKTDSAVFRFGNREMAFTTDSYVVNPIFFPGGDIGSLAVYGTVNDLAVCGARPRFISCAMVIEEGFDMACLRRVARSVSRRAREADVAVVTGDTKVVGRGTCDKLFITTSGIGIVGRGAELSADRIRSGDTVLINGPIGDHAVSVLSKREGIAFGTNVVSDTAPLYGLVSRILGVSRDVRFMRDPTRGGLAATLCEIVEGRPFGIALDEERIPVREGTRGACELLGLDPLTLANEGKVVVVVANSSAEKVLRAMRSHRLGKGAAIIGRIETGIRGRVVLNTTVGGRRIVEMPSGEQVPRIC